MTPFRERIEGMTRRKWHKRGDHIQAEDAAGLIRVNVTRGGLSKEDLDGIVLSVALARIVGSDEAVEMVARVNDPAVWASFDRCVAAWDRPAEVMRESYAFMVEASLTKARAVLDALQAAAMEGV